MSGYSFFHSAQVIVIDGNIRIKVLGVSRTSAKIGIEAPEDVRILREELLERGRHGG
ncbi:MAG: carbon storage regulator [Chloroflexi bacterium]|nr:carbon storage regulator [Chloroflexota bacterium]